MTVYWPNGSTTIPRVSSEFDAARTNPVTGIVQPHNGIDLVGWTDNCSPVDGTVIFAGYNGAAGNEVRIRADGPTAFHVGDCFRILHHASLYVSTGQRVSARQPVGRMGTTGQSTGVHCHFETHEYRLWNYVNPRDFMARANVGGSAAGGGSTPWEEPDMDANDKAIAAQTRADVAVIRQLLTETEQWKGIGAIVSETLQNVGVIRQLLTETEQWKGIGFLVSETYKTVTSLAAAVAEIADRTDDHEIDPAVIAELRAAVTDLAAINFPTEASIVSAVDLAAKQARIDELEASLAALRNETPGA